MKYCKHCRGCTFTLSFTAETDYNASVVTLVTFTSGVTKLLHTVLIVNDNDRESSEKFNATLSTNEPYVKFDNDTAIVTIFDDEGELLTVLLAACQDL